MVACGSDLLHSAARPSRFFPGRRGKIRMLVALLAAVNPSLPRKHSVVPSWCLPTTSDDQMPLTPGKAGPWLKKLKRVAR